MDIKYNRFLDICGLLWFSCLGMVPWDFCLPRADKSFLNVPRHRHVSLAAEYQAYQILKNLDLDVGLPRIHNCEW
jgi:hypothetical protein